MLENALHESSFFVTLTYKEESCPADGCVCKRSVQLWLKRLRKALAVSFRYYVVGEYGEVNLRPHYHACLFGLPGGMVLLGRHIKSCQCVICKSWGQGMVFVGTLTPESVSYVVDYTVKGLSAGENDRLRSLTPQFALMSRKPGIGVGAVSGIAEAVVKSKRPLSVLQFGRRKLPVARLLKDKVREIVEVRPLHKYRRDVPRLVDERALARAVLLSTPEGRAQHEEKRLQSGRRAIWRNSVSKTGKGIK